MSRVLADEHVNAVDLLLVDALSGPPSEILLTLLRGHRLALCRLAIGNGCECLNQEVALVLLRELRNGLIRLLHRLGAEELRFVADREYLRRPLLHFERAERADLLRRH